MFAAPSQFPQPLPRILLECAWFVRSSRSLASLTRPLLISGALALVITAVTLLSNGTPAAGFTSAWIESWLIAWPIAFPLAWLVLPRRAERRVALTGSHGAGLGLGDVEAVSRRVTQRAGRTVLRGLQPAGLPH